MTYRSIFFLATLSTAVVGGCTLQTSDADPDVIVDGSGGDASSSSSGGDATGSGGDTGTGGGTAAPSNGWVFSMSNAAEGNELLIYQREDDGSLTALNSLPTGGMGSGDGLGSQGAITISPNGEFLYLVNAGSNQISSFQIYDDHLALIDLVSSGGERPISLAAANDRVYVVNATSGGVHGYTVSDGLLTAGDSQPLSGDGVGPAQIGLNPEGNALIVTEKATNHLLTYWVAPDGTMSAPEVTPSEGATPFGFDFGDNGHIVVSEAFMGNDGESAASSYLLGSVVPGPVSSSVPSSQSAACWLVVAGGRFAYTTNTGSNTISGYTIDDQGQLALFDDGGVTADLGADQGPLDAALSVDDAFLYVINGRSDTIIGFSIGADGALERLPGVMTVPETSVGLAAR